MPINDASQQKPPQSAQTQQQHQQPAAAAPQQQSSAQQPQPTNLHSQAKQTMSQQQNPSPQNYSNGNGTLHGRRRMGYQTSQTSGIAGEIAKLFDERMKQPPNDGATYDMIVLNAGNSGLKLSAVVIIATPDKSNSTLPKEKRNILAHHTLLLSSTAPEEPQRVQHRNDWAKNRPVERTLYSFDGYDEQMKLVIKQQLNNRFPGYQQLSAEASEVPRAVSIEDKTTLNDLLANATRAAGTVLVFEGTQELSDFSLSDLTQQNGDKALLGVEISNSFAHVRGMNGYPVRGDVVLSVHESLSRRGDEPQSSYNSPDAQNRLSRIMGFIDLQWTGNSGQMMGNNGMNMMGMQMSMPHYSPQFVITDVSTEITETLPALFLALASVQSLSDNQRWKEMLIRQHVEGAAHLVSGAFNMRDLGAIGYEVTQPGQGWNPLAGGEAAVKQPFPTQGVNHDFNLLHWLVNTYIAAPTIPVSIDIAEAGTSTWVTSVLLHAALGNPKANELIVGAMNLLTNGGFSTAYAAHPNSQQGTAPIMINNNLFVNLGYWHDDGYGDRDIRDLDYLAHLVMTAPTDPAAQSDWHGLHNHTQIDPWLRLEKTTKIQEGIFRNMRITGRASRVTFNPVALFVLAQVIASQGFVFDIKDAQAGNQGVTRLVAPWLQSMNVNLGNSNAFQTRHSTRQPGVANGYGVGVTNTGRF